MKFKVGDHVIGNKSSFYSITREGWCGEVDAVTSDRFIHVRALPGHYNGRSGFDVDARCFDLLSRHADRKIVVTTDGVRTVARLYNGKVLEKSAEAKCSPDDRFDFNVGAGLAIDRLLGREAPKPGGFPREALKPGRFGRLNNGEWFVVLGDRMLYLNGGENWDRIDSLDDDGMFPKHLGFQRGIDIVVEAISLRRAKGKAVEGEFIWSRTY